MADLRRLPDGRYGEALEARESGARRPEEAGEQMTADSWEARMSARAKERERQAILASDPEPGTPCMTGDGNLRVYPTAMCQECRDRPYGTIGEPVPPERRHCVRCYGDRWQWYGNQWAQPALCDRGVGRFGRPGCDCECHEGQVGMA